ncbi:MAG TPA: YfhO family protein, partial [Cytophagales bacterium]|nr:YfhO family protein [Cytophagales bacterium]
FKPPVVQTICGLLCFYILMCSFGFSPWLSILGAFAFAYSSFNFVSLVAGHNAKISAYAFVPLLFAGVNYAFGRRFYLLGAVLFCVGLAINLSFNHFQITFYALLGAAILGIGYIIIAAMKKDLASVVKPAILLLVSAIVGIGTNASALTVGEEYAEYSIRGKSELIDPKKEASTGLDKSYAFEYSYGIGETATLFVPGIYGGGSSEPVKDKQTGEKTHKPLYHGELGIAGGTIYMGAIIFALFVVSMFVVKDPIKWGFFGIIVVGLILAWGRHLDAINYFLFDHVPGLNKFRTVMMAIMIVQFAMTVLAVWGLHTLITWEWNEQDKKTFKYGLYTLAAIFAVTLISIMGMDYSGKVDAQIIESYGTNEQTIAFINDLKEERKSLAYGDYFRSLVLAAIAIGLVYFAAAKGSFPKKALTPVLLLLVVFDLLAVDRRYLNHESFVVEEEAETFQKTAIDDYILRDTSLYYRVYNLQGNPFSDARTSYYHKSIGGYNPAKIRRYQDVIERHLQQNNFAVANMLNAKYILVNDQQMPVRTNPDALGNAWFVSKVKYVKNPDEEIEALKGFNPAQEAIVDVSKFKVSNTEYVKDSGAKLVLTQYEPDYLKFTSTNANKGLAVFSDIYYPKGWTIKIDGKPVEMLRANYILRALEIPAGNHTIEFSFKSIAYEKGYSISLVCSIVMLVAFIGTLAYQVYLLFKTEHKEIHE